VLLPGMKIISEARESRLLRSIMQNLDSSAREHWFFISESTDFITLNTLCREVNLDDYLDEEIDEYCMRESVKEFFSKDQLEDILNNLQQQRPNFSEKELEQAINFYWQNDAFIDFGLP
jgi:hypothetical protein